MCLTIDSVCCSHALGSRGLEEGGNALRLVPIADVLKRVLIYQTAEMFYDFFIESLKKKKNFVWLGNDNPKMNLEGNIWLLGLLAVTSKYLSNKINWSEWSI